MFPKFLIFCFLILNLYLVLGPQPKSVAPSFLRKFFLAFFVMLFLTFFFIGSDLLNSLAWFLGVGRGLDFLFYVSFFILFCMNLRLYRHILLLRAHISQLVSLYSAAYPSTSSYTQDQ